MTRSVMVFALTVTAFVFAAAAVVSAQSPIPAPPGPGAPAFDVASVKPGNPDPGRLFGFMPLPNGRLRVISVPVSMLIESSYGVRSYRLAGVPEWTRTTRVDIEAMAPEGTTPVGMMAMMRQLLAARFKLQAHVETRDLDGYALARARPDQPMTKLTPTVVDCDAMQAEDEKQLAANPNGMIRARVAADGRRLCAGMVRPLVDGTPMMEYVSGGQTMAGLAEFIGDRIGRPVTDRTGLVGRFNFEFRFPAPAAAPAASVAGAGLAAAAEPGLSIADGIQSIGLRLQAERTPSTVLVVDSIQQPTPD